jgi:large subunit ribosomal protein L18
MSSKKEIRRKKIHMRIRKKISGTVDRPRLCVFRSNTQIYAQLIDDLNGKTILSASSLEEGIKDQKISKKEIAKLVGSSIAKKAIDNKISSVVFDRSGYRYHGRVKELATGARENGLKF